MKTALSLVSDNQLSLTKCAVMVDESVRNRDFRSLLRAIKEHFDPHYDLLIIPKVAMDTLDFTSYTMNLGSKMLIDATRKPKTRPAKKLVVTERGLHALKEKDHRI